MKTAKLILTAFLLLALLVGCASNGGTATTAATTTSAETTTASTEAATTAVNTTTVADTTAAASTDVTTDPTLGHFTLLCAENYDPKYALKDTPVFQEWAKMANVEITYEEIPGGTSLDTVVKTRLAAGINLPDIMQAGAISDSDALNLAKKGLLMELSEVIMNYPNIKKAYTEDYPTTMSLYQSPEDGKMYWIPSYIYGGPLEGRVLSVRTDWCEKLGIETPTTTEDFYNYLVQCQEQDVNGNGKADEIWLWDSFNGASFMSGAFGVSFRDDEKSFTPREDGTIFNSYTSEGGEAFLQYLNRLYTAGVVDADPFAMTTEVYNNKLATDAVAAIFGPGYMASRDTQVMVEQGGLTDAMLQPIYTTIAGPDGTDLVVNPPIRGYGKYFIPSACSDPDAVLRWIDAIYSEQGQLTLKMGVEGEHWTRNADGTFDTSGYDTVFVEHPGIEGHAFLGTLTASVPKIEVTTISEYLLSRVSSIPYGWDPDKMVAFDEYVQTKSQPSVIVGIPTDAELEMLNNDCVELWTYMNQTATKFVTGAMSFEQWDEYVAQCNALGLEKATEIYQAMYNRFIGK